MLWHWWLNRFGDPLCILFTSGYATLCYATGGGIDLGILFVCCLQVVMRRYAMALVVEWICTELNGEKENK